VHEYGIAKEIADMVIKKSEGREIASINLEIGTLAGIYSDSLSFYLELIFTEKGMDNIKINIEKIPYVFQCRCGHRYEANDFYFSCPECGGFEREIIKGRDCIVKHITVKEGER
jgi:hydrogenase nickel incorporation protein HypA/HybF